MNDLTGGEKIMLTPEQYNSIFGKSRIKYQSICFGLSLLNNHSTTGIFWDRDTDSPGFKAPKGCWLHSVLIMGGLNRQSEVIGQTTVSYQSATGFPCRLFMNGQSATRLLNILNGTGNGPVPNGDEQIMVPFNNIMLVPIGVQMTFEKDQHPIGSELNSIIVEAPQPWNFVGPEGQDAPMLAATIVLGYE